MKAEKIYVVDTNVFVHNPKVIDDLEDNTIVVPFWVLEELDKLKNRDNYISSAVRAAVREIEKYRAQAVDQGQNLYDGVSTQANGTLIVDHNAVDMKELGIPDIHDKVDNRILLVTKNWEKRLKRDSGKKVILLSQDLLLRIKADALELRAEAWEKDRVKPESVKSRLSGNMVIEVDFLIADNQDPLTKLYKEGFLLIEEVSTHVDDFSLEENQTCLLRVKTDQGYKSALCVYRQGRLILVKRPNPQERNPEYWRHKKQIRPVNDEQALADFLLRESQVEVVILIGPAGTGKTLLSLKAAYDQCVSGVYKKVKCWRINEPLGRDLGFLPGSVEEKFGPWAIPVWSALEKAVDDDLLHQISGKVEVEDVEKLKDYGLSPGWFSVEPITFARGSTEDDTFLIIDEVQNMTPKQVKTLITRAGYGSKIVLTGDVQQIDTIYLDELSNGLSFAADRWYGSERAGIVRLLKSERSDLVKEAIERMK